MSDNSVLLMLRVLASLNLSLFIFLFSYKPLNHKHIFFSKMELAMLSKISVFTSKGTRRITGANIK
jgi:hypothetical protein